MNFNVGSVVRLRSGSPALTITEIGEDVSVEVAWYADGEFQYAESDARCLDKSSSDMPKPKTLRETL